MKSLILIIAISFSFTSFGQNGMFNQKMGQALQKYGQCRTAESYLESAMDFDQIASVETDNWLPQYYQAMCYTMASFRMLAPEATQKDANLDLAEELIEKMKTSQPGESEVFALEALYLTARLTVDPMARARKYSGLSMMAVGKALAINPKNPRARYVKLTNELGTARFFGKDTAPFCIQANNILKEWDEYTVKSQLHPNWGKPQVQAISNECNDKPKKEEIQKENKDESKVSTSKLDVEIKDIRSNDGVILAELKNDKGEIVQVNKGIISEGKSIVQFKNLINGEYSVSYFHDENGNMKMDSGKYGPTEGYGFSNNAKGIMSAPKFEKTLFELNGDLMITLKTRN